MSEAQKKELREKLLLQKQSEIRKVERIRLREIASENMKKLNDSALKGKLKVDPKVADDTETDAPKGGEAALSKSEPILDPNQVPSEIEFRQSEPDGPETVTIQPEPDDSEEGLLLMDGDVDEIEF